MLNSCWRQPNQKSVPCNINFYLDLLSENVITFVRVSLLNKMKNIVNLRKSWGFFRKRGWLRMRNCAEIFHATNVYYIIWLFHIVSHRLRKKETVPWFLNIFYTKTSLSQGSLSDMKLLKKCFLHNKRFNKIVFLFCFCFFKIERQIE